MTSSQIKAAEEICNEQSRLNRTVYSKIVSLAQAKSVQGLRAVFDEVRLCFFSHYMSLINLDRHFYCSARLQCCICPYSANDMLICAVGYILH